MFRRNSYKLLYSLIGLSLFIASCQAQRAVPTTSTEDSSIISITRTIEIKPTPTETLSEPLATPISEHISTMLSTSLQSTQIPAFHYSESIFSVTNPTWSHNGEWVGFNRQDSIWVVDTENWTNEREICQTEPFYGSLSNLVWSSDDLAIAFLSGRLCTQEEGCGMRFLVVQCDLNSGQVHPLKGLENENVQAILGWQENIMLLNIDKSLVLYNLEDAQKQFIELPNLDSTYFYHTVEFIDDQNVIYMTTEEPSIQIANIDTLESETVIPNAIVEHTLDSYGKGYAVSLAPNGKWVTWLSKTETLEGEREIKLMLYDLDTHTATTLLDLSQFPENVTAKVWSSPSWSPDSDQLVFLADHQLWVLNLELSTN